METYSLTQARTHAESQGLQIVGYYQATERLDDRALAPVGERVASKIKENFHDAFALVVRTPTSDCYYDLNRII